MRRATLMALAATGVLGLGACASYCDYYGCYYYNYPYDTNGYGPPGYYYRGAPYYPNGYYWDGYRWRYPPPPAPYYGP
jgi:hypothetical protein